MFTTSKLKQKPLTKVYPIFPVFLNFSGSSGISIISVSGNRIFPDVSGFPVFSFPEARFFPDISNIFVPGKRFRKPDFHGFFRIFPFPETRFSRIFSVFPFPETVFLSGNRFRKPYFSLLGISVTPYGKLEPGNYDLYWNNEKIVTDMNLPQGGVHTFVVSSGTEEPEFFDFLLTKENSVHMLWLVPQFFVITVGEIMFSITALEFSYSQVNIHCLAKT